MRRHLPVAIVVLAVSLLPPWAGAAEDPIRVRVLSPATLIDGSIEVRVKIKCAPFGEHFESNITISQDDQAVFAQTGLPGVECDRKWHQVTTLATSFDGTFHRGEAFASAFVSRLDPDSGETRQGQDVRTIRVR